MKNIASVLCLSIAFYAASAAAEDDGGYFGLSVGQSTSDYAGSRNPYALAVQLGYQANENFAMELQYGAFGNIAPVGQEKVSGFSIAAVGILPVSQKLSVFGKLGIASLGTRITGSGVFDVNGVSADGTYKKTAPTYGIGAEIKFNRGFGVRFGVDRYTTGGTKDTFLLNNGTLTVLYAGIKLGV